MKTPDHAAEVLVIDATGRDTDVSCQLREELVRRGLRVKVELVVPRDTPPPFSELIHEAERTDYCILLMVHHAQNVIESEEVIGYMAVPRRRHAFVPGADALPASQIAIGLLGHENRMADRIADFLAFVRGKPQRPDRQ